MHESLAKEISRSRTLKRQASSGYNSDKGSTGSNEDSVTTNDGIKGYELKAVMCGKMIMLLLSTLTDAIQSSTLSTDERTDLVASNDFLNHLDATMKSFSNKWYLSTSTTLMIPKDLTDRQLLQSVARLVDTSSNNGKYLKEVEAAFFKGMVRLSMYSTSRQA